MRYNLGLNGAFTGLMRIRHGSAIFLLLMGSSFIVSGFGQSPLAKSNSAELVPEAGFLSPSKYTNAFFGFSIPLPEDANLRELNLSKAMGGHFIVGFQSSLNGLSTFVVTAEKAGGDSVKEAKQAAAGPKSLKTKEIQIGGQTFWRGASEENGTGGRMRTLSYATVLNGYMLRFDILSFSQKLTKELEQSIERLTFFDPVKAKEMAGTDSRAYPPVALQPPRSERIDRLSDGSISGNTYHNEELGFRYQFPEGWIVNDKATQEKVAAVGHQFVWGNDLDAQKEHEAASNCTKNLLFVTQYPEGKKVEQFNPIVLLAAADPKCVPSARFPKTVDDREAIQQLAKGIVHYFRTASMASGAPARVRAFDNAGRIVIEISQTFAVNASGQGTPATILSSFLLMQAGHYWVMWMFASSDQTQLENLRNTKIFFDAPDHPVEPKQ